MTLFRAIPKWPHQKAITFCPGVNWNHGRYWAGVREPGPGLSPGLCMWLSCSLPAKNAVNHHHQVRPTTSVKSENVEWGHVREHNFQSKEIPKGLRTKPLQWQRRTVLRVMSESFTATVRRKSAATGWWEPAVICQRTTKRWACGPLGYRLLFTCILFGTTLEIPSYRYSIWVPRGLHRSLKPHRKWQGRSACPVPRLHILCYSRTDCQITNGQPVQLTMETALS